MNYPNEGKRKARKEAREKQGTEMTARIKALLDEGWPQRDEAQDKLLAKLVVSYNETFRHLPTQEELLLILGKFLQQHGDHKDEENFYPHLNEMLVILEERAKGQGSPLL
jgi:hypothetical protein